MVVVVAGGMAEGGGVGVRVKGWWSLAMSSSSKSMVAILLLRHAIDAES